MLKKLDGLSKALIFVAIFDTLFVVTMIVLFCLYQTVPDVLIESVFSATVGETSATAVIFVIKKLKQTGKIRLGDLTGFDDAEIIDTEEDKESEDE